MKTLRNVLNKILNVLAGVSLLAMVVLTCWQVFTRYILQNPSSWSEELVSYLFAWASLFGASLVTSERGHMNIPIICLLYTSDAADELKGVEDAEILRDCRRADRICVFGRYSRIWRHFYHKACDGADDIRSGRCSGRILYRASDLRRDQHDLHRAEYH